MDNRDLRRKLGKEGCFLHRTVAATNHNEFFSPEEKPVAGRAGRDAMTGQSLLIRQSNRNRRCSGGNDDGFRLDGTLTINRQ